MENKKPMTENQKKYGNMLFRFLMSREFATKEEMLEHLGWTKTKDRQLRDLLSEIAKKVPLISTSDSKGYKIAKRKEDLQEVIHQWRENDGRIEAIKERNKPLAQFYEKYGNAVDVVFFS